MFHFDRGLKLTRADLAVDFRRRQPRAFISHAHRDHMARHELALCTPETARLYHARLGERPVLEIPYRQPIDWGGLRLTTYPAGHCLGSAMLLAEDGETRLLYTGDFKLAASATAEQAELPPADVLVIESTYGAPRHRHVPRAEAIAQLLALVRDTLARGMTPVVHAYALGKAQEVTRLLTSAGIGVLQHKEVYAISQVYCRCGVDLGPFELFGGPPKDGHVVVVPPWRHRAGDCGRIRRPVTFAVTGWAGSPGGAWRLGVDHAIGLSDHADFDELLAAVARVNPRVVYCTHGPESFVWCLREAGYVAFPLGGGWLPLV
ncbi:MAG: MBL fold metallo-hydrolase [Planctomycetia bacterium]|nr:MBL fold metallo-hydrolase [Planctomycetia bacterium]